MYYRASRLWEGDGVRDFLRRHDAVHLAGWSLGGGCAVLLACFLHASGRPPASVSLFGAPRSLDASNALWYARAGLSGRTVRYETPRDPIVRLPRGDYAHVGRRVVLHSDDPGGVLGQHDLLIYHRALRTW